MRSSSPLQFNKIRLEASSACQLRCPSCPTTTGAILPVIGRGFLRIKHFRQLVDENPGLDSIELSNYGEILLNPDMLEILKYAYERGISLSASNGVNLNNVREEVLEGLVKYQFSRLNCSIDGASQETYEIYRVRGNFDSVIENIKKINHYKKKYSSIYPMLSWQFILFRHNEDDLPKAREMARELDMRLVPKLSWDDEISPCSREVAEREFGVSSREAYLEKHGKDYKQDICHQLWDHPVVNWDGKVLGCCRNFWGDFGGNAFTDGLQAALNSEKINYARGMLLGKNEAREDIPCTDCAIFQSMQRNETWLDRKKVSLLFQKISHALKMTRISAPTSFKLRKVLAGIKYIARKLGRKN